MPEKGKRYTPEFKEQAVRRVVENSAISESWNGTLKTGLVHRKIYATRKAAMDDIARWIELRYNQTRFDSTLGYRTPQEVMDEYLSGQAAA